VTSGRETRPYEVELFHNADLGLEYASADAQLTEFQVLRACAAGEPPVEEYRNRFPVTMGVDVASERALNVRITEHGFDNRRRALYIGEVEDDTAGGRTGRLAFEKLDELMRRYNVVMAAIDSQPERRSSRAFCNRFPGRAFMVAYDDSDRPQKDALKVDLEKKMVTVNRTDAIDAMMDNIRELINLPLRTPPPGYVEHLTSLKRRTEEDSETGKIKRYYVKTGPDDYAHAEVYDLVATELVGMLKIAADAPPDMQPLDAYEDAGVPRRGLYDYDPGFGERGEGY
jgi:hypothetical protein